MHLSFLVTIIISIFFIFMLQLVFLLKVSLERDLGVDPDILVFCIVNLRSNRESAERKLEVK